MHYLKNTFYLLCTSEEKVFSCEKVNHHFGYLQLFLKSPLIPLSAEGNPYPVSQLQCPRHVSLLGVLPKELLLEGLRRGMAWAHTSAHMEERQKFQRSSRHPTVL